MQERPLTSSEGGAYSRNCIWNEAWVGVCNEPTDNIYCDKHLPIRCSCGKKALANCYATYQFVCGTPTCDPRGFCHACLPRHGLREVLL